jgi:hypothetical protein
VLRFELKDAQALHDQEEHDQDLVAVDPRVSAWSRGSLLLQKTLK